MIAGMILITSAVPALAQEKQPFKSVNFAVPIEPSTMAAAAEPQAGQATANPDAGFLTFFRGTELGGLADAYYGFYSTKKPALFHAFDSAHNQFTLSMAELWLAKAPDKDSPVGFKVKLNFGPASTIINFAEPNRDLVNVQEGFVSYLAPAGKGLQFDVGKFVTSAGSEVIEAKDNWNYTRSLLFQNAIPYYHVGVRATYAANDMVTVMGGVVNGWNNAVENNTGKTVMASVTVKPTSAVSIIENYIGGPEQAGTNDNWRHLSDTVLSFTATPQVSVLGNVDYGKEKVGGIDVHWFGVAGYVKFQATPKVAVVPRVEYFDDAQGNQTLIAQKLKSATVTLELKPADNFMWRIEYRGDFSNVPVFSDDVGVAKKNQQAIVFGLLYNFSTK